MMAKALGKAAVGALLMAAAGLLAGPAAARYASYTVDVKTGRVLHSANADTRNYPASLTKMMTLYLVFEALDTGKWTLQTHLRMSRRAARQPASKLGLEAGETLSVRDAILALVTKSANDVATAVAENMSGSERNFALLMTAKARRIGMNRSTFRNASGLPHMGQQSTARDMATLARALMIKFPRYYGYFATREFTFRGQTYSNHNNLLESYDGVDGIKTGYIHASGFNLVTSAVRGGRRIIGVVLGGRTGADRDRRMAALLDSGFRNIQAAEAGSGPVAASAAQEPAPRGGQWYTASQALARARQVQAQVHSQARARVQAQIEAQRAQAHAQAQAEGKDRDWAVQVGAYRQFGPAYDIARRAIDLAPNLLSAGRIKVVPLVRKRGSPVYRARIAGLSRGQATSACRVLEQKNMDCLRISMPDPAQLASAGD